MKPVPSAGKLRPLPSAEKTAIRAKRGKTCNRCQRRATCNRLKTWRGGEEEKDTCGQMTIGFRCADLIIDRKHIFTYSRPPPFKFCRRFIGYKLRFTSCIEVKWQALRGITFTFPSGKLSKSPEKLSSSITPLSLQTKINLPLRLSSNRGKINHRNSLLPLEWFSTKCRKLICVCLGFALLRSLVG